MTSTLPIINPTTVSSVNAEKDHEKITLVNGTYLDSVINFLPHGIINKTETGIGATTLELYSKRHSIIVEPIKITASSKAQKHGRALYVGSPTHHYPSKITKQNILAYLNDSAIVHKKIVVVADSLKRVTDLIVNNADYFLMIDEADSFQNASSFRSSMEDCLDIYKSFPERNRALVTATMLSFSDPFFDFEKRTEILYQRPTLRNIDLVHTNDVNGAAVEYITSHLKAYPKGKLMVAYNSVQGCYNIAKHLDLSGIIGAKNIKIMCGSNNKKRIAGYYSELTSEKLPSLINFFTSAYFSGFDLDEDFHLISISSDTKIHALSNHKLKQIAGRCRKKLLSETVIYRTGYSTNVSQTATKDELINTATLEITALNCIEQNYSSNYILKNNLKQVRELIIANTKVGNYQLVRQDIDQKTVISFLNIDASLEMDRVIKSLCATKDMLPDYLFNEGHNITRTEHWPTAIVKENSDINIVRQQENQQMIDEIRSSTDREEIEDLLSKPDITELQKLIVNTYLAHMYFVDKVELLNKIEASSMTRDVRMLNNTRLEIMFCTLSPDNIYKQNVYRFLKPGESYTPAQLLIQWNKIMEGANLHTRLTNERTATKLTNLHFKVTRTKVGTHIIKQPLQSITVLKPRAEDPSFKNLLDLYINSK